MATLESLLLPLIRSTTPSNPDEIDSASLIYGGDTITEVIDFLDVDNDCSDSGGHVYAPDWKTGLSRCRFCGRL